jgi:hypothetical protein
MPPVNRKPAQTKKRRDFSLVIVAGITVAITAGIGAFVWWRRSITQGGGFPAIAQVVPANAQVVVAFNTDSDTWNSLGQFGSSESRQIIAQAIVQSPLSLLVKQGKLDFAKDIQPWIGDRVVTALVPVPNAPPATLIIASSTDGSKSQAFLEKYRSAMTAQGANFTEKNADGFAYFVSPSNDNNVSIVTAHIDNRYVAIASNEAVMQQLFTIYRSRQGSLAQKELFVRTQTVPTQIPNPLVQIYLDGSIEVPNLNLPAPTRAKIQAVTASVGVQREGLRWEIDTHLQSPQDNIQVSSNQILKAIPESAFLVITGNNLTQSWQSLHEQSQGNPTSQQFVSQLKQGIKDATGWDVEQDLLPWTTGEFAVVLVADKQGILTNTGFGLALLLQTSDPNATKSAMAKLDSKVRETRGGLFPQGVEVKSTGELTTWQVGSTVVASRGVTAQGLVLWTMGELHQQFLPTPARPLPDTPLWQLLTSQLSSATGGYFYLHITSALALLESRLPPEVKANPTYQQTRTVLDSIEGIAATSTRVTDRTARLEILFTLKPIPAR